MQLKSTPETKGAKKASRSRLRVWLLSDAASVAVCVAAAIWYLHRPPPPLRITRYTQITLDGQRKGVSATDGSRLYLNSDSPNLPSQIAASGGDRVPLHITVPGRQFGIHDVSPDGSELLISSLPVDSEVPGLWTQSILGGTFRAPREVGVRRIFSGRKIRRLRLGRPNGD